MPSRAVVLHAKDPKVKTAGGLTAKKLVVSKSSGEVVSKAKAKQGKETPWARATKYCLTQKPFSEHKGIILFNDGALGKKFYTCVKNKSQEL